MSAEKITGERLQKVLAHAGVASRRKCEEYIVAGRVAVNGQVVTELGTRVDPQADRIAVDGKPLNLSEALVYYLVYKPRGYVSTVSDPEGRPTVVSLVPDKARLYPVGRLDLDSEGLLLLTNDGELTLRLTHPRHEHEKEYVVLTKGRLNKTKLDQLAQGVDLPEATSLASGRFSPLPREWTWRDEVTPHDAQWMRVILKEGQKRQIRRMLQAVRLYVLRIIRVRMGVLRLDDLQPGQGRWLNSAEIASLRRSVGL